MRVLVTGGTGFIGSHLVEILLRRGDEVSVLARSPHKASGLARVGITTISGDLDDRESLRRATRGQEVVYHLAGTLAAHRESEFFHTNSAGTLALVDAALQSGAPRFVLVSSLAAAGPASRGRPLRGGEPPRPVTAYGRSKLAGEEVVRQSALPWTIVRPPLVYGPRDKEVLRVFKSARLGIVPMCGDGSQELSAVYAPDLAEALVAVAEAPAAIGRTYCACHEGVFTSGDLVRGVGLALDRRVRIVPISEGPARLLLTLTGTAAFLAGQRTLLTRDKANELFQAAWTGDPAPLRRDTGWRARHDLAAGIAATASWYRAAGWI